MQIVSALLLLVLFHDFPNYFTNYFRFKQDKLAGIGFIVKYNYKREKGEICPAII